MGGMRRRLAAFLALATLTALVPAAPVAQATSDGCGDTGCSLTREISGDFWVGDFEGAEEFTIRAGSTIQATLGFNESTERSGLMLVLENLDTGEIPFGAVVWVKATRDETEVYHEQYVGWSSRPVGELEWDEERVTVRWNVDQTLADARHRLVVTGPRADTLDVSLNLQSPNSTTLAAESSGATGGALVYEEGWAPSVLVQGPSFKYLEDGERSITVPSDRRLYGYHGPATSGSAAADACFIPAGICGAVVGGFGTNWGHSVFGLERPDGSSEQREFSWPACTPWTCGSGSSNAFVFVDEQPGTWTLTVDEHEGVGAAPNMLGVLAPIELP